MVCGCPWVAVYLYVWMCERGNAVEVRSSHEDNRFMWRYPPFILTLCVGMVGGFEVF